MVEVITPEELPKAFNTTGGERRRARGRGAVEGFALWLALASARLQSPRGRPALRAPSNGPALPRLLASPAAERKSRRARKGRVPIRVSSTDTITELKLKVWGRGGGPG
jgi:hypothetical protein